MKNTQIKKKKSKPSQIYMEKIKDRNEHQKQNLLKNQKLNTRKKYSQTPQHTETPPSPQRVSRRVVCCSSPLFF